MWTELFLLFLLLILLMYYFFKRTYTKIASTGIPMSDPIFPIGSWEFWQCLMGKVNIVQLTKVVAENPKLRHEKIFAYFIFNQPIVVVQDEDLAKRVLIKDFEYFSERRTFNHSNAHKSGRIMNRFLTNLSGEEWKKSRTILSGVFTSGKLKQMTPHIVKVGKQFESYLLKMTSSTDDDESSSGQHTWEDGGLVLEAKELAGKLTLDAIATSGFGLEVDSFDDPDNLFKRMSERLTQKPSFLMVKIFLAFIFPKLAKYLSFMDVRALEFFSNCIEQTYKKRMETKTRRNDFIDMIVDEFNAAKTEDSDLGKKNAETEKEESELELTLLSNAFIFFFAGYETTSSGIAVMIHYLVKNQDLQEMIVKELEEAGLMDEDEMSFEKIHDLKLLDKFLQECYRRQELVLNIERMCSKTYTVPELDYVIEKGTAVQVYPKNITVDPKNFVYPDEFNPENFAADNNPNKFGVTFFGHGPRNCVGMRYAQLTLKVTAIHLLRKFKLLPCSKTKDEITLETKSFRIEGWFKLQRR